MFIKNLPCGSSITIQASALAGTIGSVLFFGASRTITEDNPNFFWDDTNNRLGIGTNTPAASLTVNGDNVTLGVNATNAETRPVEFIGDNATGEVVGIRNTNASGIGSMSFEDETGAVPLAIGFNTTVNTAFIAVGISTEMKFTTLVGSSQKRVGSFHTIDSIFDGSVNDRAVFVWGRSSVHTDGTMFEVIPPAIDAPANGNFAIVGVQGAAHTAFPTPTDFKVVDFQLGQTIQFATGNFSDAFKALKITHSILAATGSTTITRPATVYINNAPQQGTNVTLSDPCALLVEGGKTRFDGDLFHNGSNMGFFAATPTTKKTVSGSRSSNAALASLLTALANYGIVIDSSS